jgi:hypothetical protein
VRRHFQLRGHLYHPLCCTTAHSHNVEPVCTFIVSTRRGTTVPAHSISRTIHHTQTTS